MEYIEEFREIVERGALALGELSPAEAERRPAPEKWSAKEIIGHLIDSAANNHGRFVRAQAQDHLLFTGYDQDAWIAAQDYRSAPWPELVMLWRLYNLHIARVMELVSPEIRLREHASHNLHEIAWQAVPPNEPATLDYFMRDYIGHLRHHLAQIPALRDHSALSSRP